MKRYALYNGAGILAVAVALTLTQLRAGGPWLDVAAFFCGPIAAAVPLALIVGRVSRRRFDRLGAATATQPTATARPIYLTAATGESA